MIAYLAGTVQKKTEDFIILNTQGVGYLVHTALETLSTAKEGKSLELYIYTIVREQEISLYGFANMGERQFFELLISVSGIGPKSALEFLNLPMETVKDAIATGDTAFITKVKGVGKKTAERVVVELKNKIGTIYSVENIVASDENEAGNSNTEDMISALENLGYDRMHIVKKLKNAPRFENIEEAIMWFLQNN